MQADPMPPQVTAETLFIEMPETFYFLSGAGAWQTELHLADDGSFTGRFEDADMGSYDEKRYPMGTVYVCDFSGVFVNPVQVDDYTWSVHVESLTYEEPGTETLEDGYLYITSGPYGLDNVDEVLVYLPGYPVAELSEEVFSWLRSGKEFWNGEGPDMLPFYALNNVNEQMGFFAPNEWP